MAKISEEIEIKFLEINVPELKKKLTNLGAEDLGEDFLSEITFYDKDLEWKKDRKTRNRFVRLRKTNKGVFLTYKSQYEKGDRPYAEELEVTVSDMDKAEALLKAIGLVDFRRQEKKRHTYELDGCVIDIDSWPVIPPYVEIEGPSEQEVKNVVEKLGYDWNKGVFEIAGRIIEKYYNIPVMDYKFFTFDKMG